MNSICKYDTGHREHAFQKQEMKVQIVKDFFLFLKKRKIFPFFHVEK
jgi:hypothetical protein